MKALYTAGFLAFFMASTAWGQTFTNSSNLLSQSFTSGGVTGVTDMNNDDLDDLVIMDESENLYLAYQQSDGSFVVEFITSVSNNGQWGMCVGDMDNDGHKDVMCGGSYDGVHIVNINSPSDFTLTDPQNTEIFMQACNFADIDNDGWLDGFACHDDGPSHRFRNNGSGSFINGNDLFDYMVYPNSDMSGNYGSEWSDFDRDGDLDLMVAKCRQFVNDPYDPRRTNLVFVNDGNNNYEDQAHERGLVNLQQSWTSNFADIDNDGDFDCFITTHSGTLEIYENNGLGYFTNITVGSGIEIGGFFLQGKLVDFDNDGFVDILYAGGNAGLFHNNGDKTFTAVNGAFPGPGTMHSFAIGDLNFDGWLDVFCNYGSSYITPTSTTDRIYMNDGGTNHWVAFDLEGTMSNMDAVGALVEIHGPWGIQIREVRAGESYGITNTSHLMFGIGANTSIDYAVIHWPAGGTQVIENPAIDTYHQFTEGDCTAPVATISAVGSTTLCAGQFVTLQVDSATDSFVWSNGAIESSTEISTPGLYSVYVYNANTTCAAQSNVIMVELTDVALPVVAVSGDLEFCEGESVQLIAPEGTSYIWSTEQNTQTISVTESGDYSVGVEGLCGVLTSSPITVSVLPAPAPVAADITLQSAGTAELTASSTNVLWYDSEVSDTPIGSGSPFITGVISSSTSFWVEEVHTYGGEEGTGGKLTNESSSFGQFHNSSNFWNRFDANEDIILNSVKVYAGNTGNRTIQLVNSNATVLQELTVEIPEGESFVTLDFFVPAGTNYGLRTSNSNPQLWRDRNVDTPTPFAFPYELDGLATITGTTVSGGDSDNYYYFFYDWTVSTPTVECVSAREEVQITVVGIEENEFFTEFNLYPNPAVDELSVSFDALVGGAMQLRIIDATGKVAATRNVVAVNGRNNLKVSLNEYAAGLYQIQLVQDGQTITRRVVVQ